MKTFSVLIPALNEGGNIGGLLSDILGQELGDGLALDRIVVVSDGSTDNTDDEVSEAARSDTRVVLLRHETPRGKASCINDGMAVVTGDLLVLLDGDVRLGGPLTLRELLTGLGDDVGMVGGNPYPVPGGRGIAARVSRVYDILRNYAIYRMKEGSNVYSAHGRILALSRDYYSQTKLPSIEGGSSVLSTDQFLYYSCLRSGMRFELRENATVFYRNPGTMRDYLRQSIRYMYSVANTRAFFDDPELTADFHIPFRVKVGIMVELFRREPLGAAVWLTLRPVLRMAYAVNRYVLKRDVAAAWRVSETTKAEITGGGGRSGKRP